MSRLALFLLTLATLAALVLVFLAYDLTAAVATGVVLALAGAATTVVLRLTGTESAGGPQVTGPAQPQSQQAALRETIAAPQLGGEPVASPQQPA